MNSQFKRVDVVLRSCDVIKIIILTNRPFNRFIKLFEIMEFHVHMYIIIVNALLLLL